LLVVIFLSLAGYVLWLQLELLVRPQRNPNIGTPAALSPNYEEITLTTSDGLQLSAWYIPGRRSQAVIVVHGLNTNRAAVLPEAAVLAEAGYQLLLLDLRGHGHSQDSLVSYGYREAWDVQAGLDYLSRRPEVEQIGALGSSLGGAAVARAAALDSRLQAVVIEDSYSSLPDAVGDAFDDLTIFPQWPFAPLIIALAERRVGLKISQVDSARDLATLQGRPVLIIHKTDNRLFPVEHAERMYRAAGEPKQLWLIEGLGPANPAVERPAEFRERVVGFFDEAFSR
jgi:dipeptidyl aminopeptidase/acylaminoacyl peptidase